MDTAGAVVGPLAAAGTLAVANNDVRLVFWLATLPDVVSVLVGWWLPASVIAGLLWDRVGPAAPFAFGAALVALAALLLLVPVPRRRAPSGDGAAA